MNGGEFDEEPGEDSPELAREVLDRELRTVGARAAYDALLQVAQDAKAPAPARATAGVAILRAAGFFARDDEAHSGKGDHEMTLEEMDRKIQRLERRSKKLRKGSSPSEERTPSASVFD